MTLQNEIKGNLARLLATENLIVEHRADISTASFDVQRRVLQLPKWDLASNTVYDMLVGHEVGHALFTPNEDPSEFGAPMEFVNVIEDSRIEKLIKRKYAGLPKIFNTAYRELSDDDFFGIEGEELDQLTLIDRINLHCKVGAYAMIPFAEDEVVFVKRTEAAETFEEVLEIAKDVYGEQKRQKESLAKAEQGQEGSGTGSQDHSENSTSAEQETESSEGGEDGDQSDEGGFKISQQPSADNGDTTGGMGGQSYDDDEVRTQQAFDEQTESLSRKDYHGRPNQYVELPKKLDINKITVDWTEIHDWIDQRREAYIEDQREYLEKYSDYGATGFDEAKTEYQKFRKQSQKEVNYLVKEFEMKKSADSYARQATARTGVLDTSKLHTYMFNEDIFKKITVIPEGKNHGLVFLLDWSGSMQTILENTMKQLFNLVWFCRKVNIPFEVYAFTNDAWSLGKEIPDNTNSYSHYNNQELLDPSRLQEMKEGDIYIEGGFRMVNILTSTAKTKDLDRMMLNLWLQARAFRGSMYQYARRFTLSGTPLNEAIISVGQLTKQLIKTAKLQKCHVIVLTDGEGYHSSFNKMYESSYDGSITMNHSGLAPWKTTIRVGSKSFVGAKCESEFTCKLVEAIKSDIPNCNFIGIRILEKGGGRQFYNYYARNHYNFYDEMKDQMRRNGAVFINTKSFDLWCAVQQTTLHCDDELEVDAGVEKRKIAQAFRKMNKNKKSNKFMAKEFIKQIA